MKTSLKIFYWTPRILGILMTLFIGMFALDAFDPRLAVLRQVVNFLIQLIPAYIALVTVIIAWKWDLAGCLVYLLLSLFYASWAFHHPLWILGISVPLMALSILFFVSWYLSRKNRKVS
jgi:hypothetical protein